MPYKSKAQKTRLKNSDSVKEVLWNYITKYKKINSRYSRTTFIQITKEQLMREVVLLMKNFRDIFQQRQYLK